MSLEKKQKNLPIPEEAIEGPAGKNDVFGVYGYGTKVACKENDKKPTKRNTQTIVESPNQRQVRYDIGLAEGMVIPAKDGGIEITQQEKDGIDR